MSLSDPRGFLRTLFDAAIAAAQPERCLPPHLPQPPRGRTIAVGDDLGRIRVIDLASGNVLRNIETHSKSMYFLAFIPALEPRRYSTQA